MLIHVIHMLQAGVATTLTQPIDVIKTRTMNARPGEFKVNSMMGLRVSKSLQLRMQTSDGSDLII